jgi:hypothetical protein
MDILSEAFSQILASFSSLADRYCLFVKITEPKLSRRQAIFIQAVITFQTLSLLVPIDDAEGLPWNYSSLGLFWTAIHMTVRPDSLVVFLSNSQANLTIFFSAILALLLLTFYLVSASLFSLSDIDFIKLISQPHKSRSRLVVKLHCFIRTVVADLLLIPFCFGAIRASKGSPYIASDYSAPYCLVLVGYLPIVLLHTLSLVRINWNESFESISSPFITVVKAAWFMVLCVVTAVIDYPKHKILYSALLIILGFSYCCAIAVRRPYYKAKLNLICLVQGFIVLLAGCCFITTTLLEVDSPEGGFTTLLFFVPLVPMLYLAYTLMSSFRATSLVVTSIVNPYSLELLLREEAKKASLDEATVLEPDSCLLYLINETMKTNKQDPFLLIWVLNYALLIQDRFLLKKFLASLAKFRSSWVVRPHVLHSKYRVTDFLDKFPDEKEAYNFAAFKDELATLLSLDEAATMTTLDFYEELGKPSPKFTRLEELVNRLRMKMVVCKGKYKNLLRNYSKDISILEYYAGYLASIENSLKADQYVALALKQKQDGELHRRNRAELSYFDLSNCIFIVSLESEDLGLITWVNKPDLLGYTQNDLLESDIHKLLPSSIAFDLKSVTTQLDFAKISTSLFKDKAGYIVPGTTKCALINELVGDLSLLFTFKPNDLEGEFALVHEETSSLLSRVTPTQTEGLDKYLKEELSLAQDDLTKPWFMFNQHELMDEFVLAEDAEQNLLSVSILDTFFKAQVTGVRLKRMLRSRMSVFGSEQLLKGKSGELVSTSHAITTFQLLAPVKEEAEGGSEGPVEQEPDIVEKEVHSSSSRSTSVSQLAEKRSSLVKRRLLRCIRLLKVSFVLTVRSIQSLLFAASCIIVSTLIRNITEEMNVTMKLAHDYGELMWTVENLAYRSKQLYLLNQGHDFDFSEAEIRADMAVSLEFMENSLTKFRQDLIDAVVYSDRDDDRLLFLQWQVDHFLEERMNLHTVLSRLEVASREVLTSSLEDVTSRHSGFMTLHRNAPKEVVGYFNQTIIRYVDKSQDRVDGIISLVMIMVILSGAVFLLCVGGLILPVLFFINTQRKQLWMLLYSLPLSIVRLGKNRALERLMLVHSEFEEDRESSARAYKRKFEYKTHKLQWLIYLVLGVLLGGLAGYLYAVAHLVQTQVNTLLSDKADYYYWSDLSKVMAQSTLFWQREIAFPGPQFDEFNAVADPYLEYTTASDEMMAAELRLKKDFGEVSTQHFDFVNRDACTSSNEADCVSFIRKGLHSAIYGILFLERWFVARLRHGEGYFEAGGAVVEYKVQTIISYISNGADIFENETEKLLTMNNDWIYSTTWVVTMMVFVYYFICVRPLINVLNEVIRKEVEVPLVLPKDQMEELRRLLLAWKI